MPRDFFPRREADILQWTAAFSARINAAPQDYSTTPEQADAYALAQRAFADAYRAAQDRGTNSSTAFAAKTAARVALEAATRLIVKRIGGTPTVTDEMRIALGLKPRRGGRRRRTVPAPETAPILRVLGVAGHAFTVRLEDAKSPARRGKARDAHGAMIFGFVGDDPPAGRDGWALRASTTRATAAVTFDAGLPPGTPVWLTAYWFNRRAERGPSSTPVLAHIPHDVASFQRGAARLAA
jgi:hypothetical protein